jgi:site-specific DNA recombinase
MRLVPSAGETEVPTTNQAVDGLSSTQTNAVDAKVVAAVIYCRFSPRPNSDECESNQQQLARCVAYCEKNGFYVVGSFCDSAVSGGVLNRPELQKAINYLHPGFLLVADRPDRLARDMAISLAIRKEIEDRGARLVFADGNNFDTAESELLANIMSAFAQFERKKFSQRTKNGLAKKRLEGVRVGRPPYGYKVVDGKMCENEDEQWFLSLAETLYRGGDSFNDIVNTLRNAIPSQSQGRPVCMPPSIQVIRRYLRKRQKGH